MGQWLDVVEAATGKKPVIYTGTWFWDPQVGSNAYGGYPLWESWYCGSCCPKLPAAWSKALLWQYSSSGKVSGISGNVDMDLFDGSLDALKGYTFGPTVTGPVMDIWAKTSAPDVRPEGASKGIGDAYEGDTFTVDVFVKNAAGALNTEDYVRIGYWIESPWLEPVTYTISSDWPVKDGATFKVNDSDSAPDNPPKTGMPTEGQLNLYAMGAGETKRVRFTLKAVKYSLGEVDHPDLRAWVWHVGNYYGEQVGWSDPVETNKAGKVLQTYVQHDVYGKTHWEWNGDDAMTEGWVAGNGLKSLIVNAVDHCLAADMAGQDPFFLSPELDVKAAALGGLSARVRAYGGPKEGRLYFVTKADGQWNESKAVAFEVPGDGAFHDVTVDVASHPAWSGKVTQLRLDPAPKAEGWYDVDYVRLVPSVGPTTGDTDEDGVVASADCDDTDPSIFPGAPEICDGKDDDCDAKTDEGLPGCQDGCVKTGAELCHGKDDDCDGLVDEDFPLGAICAVGTGACASLGQVACGAGDLPTCNASPGAPSPEQCNGVDDDCDDATDEDFGLGATCEATLLACVSHGHVVCAPEGGQATACDAPKPVLSVETCNGQDDDCDGPVDEDFGVGDPCTEGEGVCATTGLVACNSLGATFCKAPSPDAKPELCDGEVDEDFPIGEPCEKILEKCNAIGTFTCNPTGLGVDCVIKHAAESACPGVFVPGEEGEDAGEPETPTEDGAGIERAESVGGADATGAETVLPAPGESSDCAAADRPSSGPVWLLLLAFVAWLRVRRRRAGA